MVKQYGIDPRLVIWIQKNTGHDLQTFSDLVKIKCLDSRRRNFSAVKKIEDVRLPSWLVIKDDDFSLIGEMTKLKQLSLHDIAIDDYSFLGRCRNLNTLNLQDTNFSDCRLLTEFPALKKVFLPAYSQLKHTEVLEQLSCLKEIKEEKPGETEQACQGIVSDGELRETQMTNYFSNLYPIDCAVLSVNAQFYRKYGTLPAHEFLPEI